MRKLIVLFFCLTLFNGCKYFRGDNCNNTKPIVGVYQNKYDKEAKNILQMFEDGTFEQTFTKGDIVKKNKGTWRMSPVRECYVTLTGLKILHELPKSSKEFFTDLGKFRLNNIVFVEGMSFEFNYYRIE